ncbi:MAG TPA: hypothetical protein VHB97_24965 [Polyangia bacterium]|nr:hypothetical protein [Polyangia bacterium]
MTIAKSGRGVESRDAIRGQQPQEQLERFARVGRGERDDLRAPAAQCLRCFADGAAVRRRRREHTVVDEIADAQLGDVDRPMIILTGALIGWLAGVLADLVMTNPDPEVGPIKDLWLRYGWAATLCYATFLFIVKWGYRRVRPPGGATLLF